MRRSDDDVNERRDKIFSKLLEHGEINVSDISEQLGVSQLTIRRDLEFFENKRLIERFYGGAKLVS